jgi:YaiO family outer membrane protein
MCWLLSWACLFSLLVVTGRAWAEADNLVSTPSSPATTVPLAAPVAGPSPNVDVSGSPAPPASLEATPAPAAARVTQVGTGAVNKAARPHTARQRSPQERKLLTKVHAKPKDSIPRFAYANWLYRVGRTEDALTQANLLLRLEPKNSDYLIFKARVLFRQNQTASAQALLKRAIALTPRYADAHRLLLTTSRAEGSQVTYEAAQAGARKYFPSAWWVEETPVRQADGIISPAWLRQQMTRTLAQLRKRPADVDARFHLGMLKYYEGNWDHSQAILEGLIRKNPADADYRAAKATVLVGRSRQMLKDPTTRASHLGDVQQLLKSALKQAPGHEDSLRMLVATCRFPGSSLDCAPFKQDAERRYPAAIWWRDFVPQHDSQGQLDTGWLATQLSDVEAVLVQTPDDDEARYRRAQLLGWGKRFAEALAEYDILLAANPDNFDAIAGKSWALTMQAAQILREGNLARALKPEQLAEARQLLQQAITADPSQELPFRVLISTCRDADNNGVCDPVKEQAAKIFPRAFWWKDYTPKKLPDGTIDPKWLADNVADLQRYLAERPDDLEASAKLAQLLGWQGQLEAAMAQYDKLLAQSPQDGDYLSGKAWILTMQANQQLRVQRLSEAQAMLEQALAQDPKNEGAYRMLLNTCRRKESTLDYEAVKARAAQHFPDAWWLDDYLPQRVAEEGKKPGKASAKNSDRPIDPAWLQQKTKKLEDYLSKRPEDVDARLKLAQLQTWNRAYDQALAQYNQVLAQDPQHTEARIAKGRVLTYAGKPGEAIELLAPIQKTPGFDETGHEALIRAYISKQDWDQAKQGIAVASAAYPLRDWKKEFEDGIPHLEQFIEFQSGIDNVSGPLRSWNEQELGYMAILPNKVRLSAGVYRAHRFRKDDWGGRAGVSVPLFKGLVTTSTNISFSPLADFLPRFWLDQGISVKLPWKFTGSAHYLFRDFSGRAVHGGNYTLESYAIPNWRLAYTLMTNATAGETLSTHLGTATRYYGKRNFIQATLSMGRSLEVLNIPNTTVDRLLLYDTVGASINGLHYVSERWGITYGVNIQRLENLFTRTGVNLGLQRAI